MRILRPIVQALVLAMFHAKAHLRSRSAVRTEFVRYHHARRPDGGFQELLHEPLRSAGVSSALDQDVEHEARVLDQFDGLPSAMDSHRAGLFARTNRWGGREHFRGEFMLLPGETAEQMQDPATVWKLFAPYGVGPDNVDIVRRAVYRFRGLLTESFRNNRVLLMGDSAHLMPPFLGQGACAGIRDAQNLAWKLDLVLRGLASSELLDTYTPERKPHVEAIIRNSIPLGQVVCVSDPEIGAKRDQAFLSGMVPPPPPFPGLTNGILHRSPTGKVEDPVGQLAVQGRVRHRGVARRFDDVFGPGWMWFADATRDR